ncbi:MAG: hypothetical protein FWH55_07735 [Oscillospiraceae bacterium]|nr:hypothetical protein [Oscillospiraceae bacterium]
MVLSLNHIMKKKLSLLYEIYTCTSQEYVYANEEGIEQLGNLIQEKQELILEIDYLDRRFLAEFEDVKKELGVSSLETLGEKGDESLAVLKLNTSEIMDILKKIDALDKKVHAKVAKLRSDLSQELTKIKKQRHVSEIYSSESSKGATVDFSVYDASKNSSFDKKK